MFLELSLATEPIWFSFTVNLIICPVKIYNSLGEGKVPTLSKEKKYPTKIELWNHLTAIVSYL